MVKKHWQRITAEVQLPIRLDRYLAKLNSVFTQGTVQKLLRNRLIKVNGKKAEANLRIIGGEEVSAYLEYDIIQEAHENKSFSDGVISLASKVLTSYKIYEDDNLLAINKPAGIATQGGTKITICIDDALQYLNTQGYDLRLVHRLDKDTSGVLLIAKNYAYSVRIMQAFQDNLIEKTYIAVTSGIPQNPKGTITSYFKKQKIADDFEVTTSSYQSSEGKIAITNYQLISQQGNNAVVEFKPVTGRMHQIRVHAKELGCPILGDKKYSLTKISDMLLHAKKLIIQPNIIIEAELPKHFNKYMR